MEERCILCYVCFVPWSVFALLFQSKKQRPEGAVWSVAQELQNHEVSNPEEPKVLIPGHP